MQTPDQEKHDKILAAAAQLFAAQPYHKVLLSEVAEMVGVGKGTLYTYFKNKEDLYFAVLYTGFSELVERLHKQVKDKTGTPVTKITAIIREIVDSAYKNPHRFEVMRAVPNTICLEDGKWDQKRKDMKRIIQSIIEEGINLGIFEDPHPELTARFIPGCVRSVMLQGIEAIDAPTLTDHILRFVLNSLQVKEVPL